MYKNACLAKADAIADLSSAFTRLDCLLGRAVAIAQNLYESTQSSSFPGLQIQVEEVYRLLAQPPGKPLLWSSPERSSANSLPFPRQLTLLSERFSLNSFDIDVIIIAIAPEFDLRYERIYAFLQDDITRRRPSIDLTLNLLCQTTEEKLVNRARLAADSPLIRSGLVMLSSEAQPLSRAFISTNLHVNYKLVQWLLGETELDERLHSFCR